jgi:hypothetical protein
VDSARLRVAGINVSVTSGSELHDKSHNRFEPLNLNLSDLSVVEQLHAGQQLLVHRTVALMLKQTFPLQEYDGSHDNLLSVRVKS